MPFLFNSRPQRQRRAEVLPAHRDFVASVADEIAQAETIDRLTLWPTLRIRTCLRLHAIALNARSH